MEQRQPIGSSIILKDLTTARQLLTQSQQQTQKEISDKDAFVVSNLVWKHRSSYGPVDSFSASTPIGALEKLQRRGQVALAQGLGLEGTALFTGLGLAQQYPPEIYLTSGTLLALAGLGYMQVRWKAAESEFKAQAEVLAEKLKEDIVVRASILFLLFRWTISMEPFFFLQLLPNECNLLFLGYVPRPSGQDDCEALVERGPSPGQEPGRPFDAFVGAAQGPHGDQA